MNAIIADILVWKILAVIVAFHILTILLDLSPYIKSLFHFLRKLFRRDRLGNKSGPTE